MPNQMMMPGMPARPSAPPPQAMMPQPAQWQAAPPARMPSLANLASGGERQPQALPPAKTRGVSSDLPVKFVLPSPEALGVTTNFLAPVAAKTPVDWNQIQARLERLGVLRYEKDRPAVGGVRVMLLLPTSDPTRGQPIEAHAETEAAAIMMALQAAEAWTPKR